MKKRILIVDDSKQIRDQVEEALEAAGFETLQAADGRDGARIIDESTLDLVFCDIHMPRTDGIEMLAQVRADPANDLLPVVMLTAEGSPAQIARARKLGAKGWIVKPIAPDRLVAIARKLTGEDGRWG